jgi:hypothetical protein
MSAFASCGQAAALAQGSDVPARRCRFIRSPRRRDKAVLAGLSDQRSAALITDLGYFEDVNAFERLENLLRSNGQWFHPHPWLLTFLPGSNAEQVAGEILDELTNEDVGPFGDHLLSHVHGSSPYAAGSTAG